MNKPMASNISTSLIISTYNRSDALEICVKSVLRQSLLPDEIIIADDGSKEDTRELIHQLAASSEVPIIHVWHEDLGFRLAPSATKLLQKHLKNILYKLTEISSYTKISSKIMHVLPKKVVS